VVDELAGDGVVIDDRDAGTAERVKHGDVQFEQRATELSGWAYPA